MTPIAVVHDGLQAYGEAFSKEFYTLKPPRVQEVRSLGLRENGANQGVERLQGTVRERNKVMRGLKKEDIPVVEGFQTYNFLRRHMGLDGKTPAQAAGIGVEAGGNGWLPLLKEALKHPVCNTPPATPQ